ncbi:hypothetical protein [Desulfosporosinus shakirovi]|uniref:hypothetical protein n=1 Tax=Desulfosporosinus shakirovi TaxID=2885154 RepID=UPI001E65552D|nr:hypothetical protein [Desulfosporosinus sp. SRJS8]MCB8818082.1 hypothetical protein [Desulfosporosinus sp. SRJS8]
MDYVSKWYNKADNNFHVPVSEITDILNKYFNGINSDATKINGYNAKTKEIVTGLQGFGGERFPKLSKKETISDNTLRVTADFYDDTYKNVNYTKVYTICFTASGYQYLSIVKI